MLAQHHPQANYSLFEPTRTLRAQAEKQMQAIGLSLDIHADVKSIADRSMDVIVCQEVMEHLPDTLRTEALDQFQRLLKDNGRLIISVPIEIGLSALFKNLVRVLIGQTHESSSLMNFTRATFGRCGHIPRVSRNGYIDSHLGFDYRKLEQELLHHGWKMQRRVFSPLPWAGGLFNSQVFYKLQRP